VATLEARAADPAHAMEKHAHPRLTPSNLRGCGAREWSKRVLVEMSSTGNCRIDSFWLVQTPGPAGPGPCTAELDVVIQWIGWPGGPSEPTRVSTHGSYAAADGSVFVVTKPFVCPSPAQIREVWVVPPGFDLR
jgi:hypothetical protein